MLEAADGLKNALHRMGAERDLLVRTRAAQEDAAMEWRLRCEIAMGGIVPALTQRCKELASLKRVLWAYLKKESAARLGLDSLVETLLTLETVVLADDPDAVDVEGAKSASATTGLVSGLGLLDPVVASLLLQSGTDGNDPNKSRPDKRRATMWPPGSARLGSDIVSTKRLSLKSVALCVLATVRLRRRSYSSARGIKSNEEVSRFCYYLVPGVGRLRIDIPVVSGVNLPGDGASSTSSRTGSVTSVETAPLVTAERAQAALTRLMASITTGGNLVSAASLPFERKREAPKEIDSRPQTFVSAKSSVLPVWSNETDYTRYVTTSGLSSSSGRTETLPASFTGATTGDILEALIMSNEETSRLWRNRYVTPYQSVLVQSALRKLASHLCDARTRAAKSEASMRASMEDTRAAREIASEAQAARIRAQRRSAALEDRLRSYVEAQCNMNGLVAPKQEFVQEEDQYSKVSSGEAGTVGADMSTASLAGPSSSVTLDGSLTVSGADARTLSNAPSFVNVSAALFDDMRRERDALKKSCELLSIKSRTDGERWRAVEEVLTGRLSGITAEAKTLKIRLEDLKADHTKCMKALKVERKSSARKVKQAGETIVSLQHQLEAGADKASELETARESVAQELARVRVEQRKSFAEWKERQLEMQRRHNAEIAARSQHQQSLETKIAAAEEKAEWAGRAVEAKERLWAQERTGMLQQIERGRFRERLLAESNSPEMEEEEEEEEEGVGVEDPFEAEEERKRGRKNTMGLRRPPKSTAKALKIMKKTKKRPNSISRKGKSKSKVRDTAKGKKSTSTRMGARTSNGQHKTKPKSARRKGKVSGAKKPPPGQAVEEAMFGSPPRISLAEYEGETHSSDDEEDEESQSELIEMKQYIDRIDRRLYTKYGTPPRKASPVHSPRGGQSAKEEELLIPRMGPK